MATPILRNSVVGVFGAILAAGLIPAQAASETLTPGVGAIAFAKVSTNLSSSLAPSYYDADPDDLGAFYNGGVQENGLTSAAAAAPCQIIGPCEVPTLVPNSQGEAAAAADLASGTLRVFAFSDGRTEDSGSFAALLQAEAFAGFRDILTILEDGTLHFDLHISGTDTYDPRDGGTQDYINFLINGAAARTVDGNSLASNDGVTGFGCGSGDSALTLCDVDLLVDVPVVAGEQLDWSLLLGSVVQDGTADYSHTLSLNATGVQFTSASGVFLTGMAPGVPEPPTWAMMLIGFGGVGYAIRRRRNPEQALKTA